MRRAGPVLTRLLLSVLPQLVDEEFDALEGFFYALEQGILQLLENVEVFLHHLQVRPSHLLLSPPEPLQPSSCGSAAVPGLQSRRV